MAKVYFDKGFTVPLSDLNIGDFFRFEDELFIKIKDIDFSVERDGNNAISLSDNCVANIWADEEVVPIDSNKVTITVAE